MRQQIGRCEDRVRGAELFRDVTARVMEMMEVPKRPKRERDFAKCIGIDKQDYSRNRFQQAIDAFEGDSYAKGVALQAPQPRRRRNHGRQSRTAAPLTRSPFKSFRARFASRNG